MEKNAGRVAHDVAAMTDDELGPAGDFIKCYVTQREKSPFFFNQSYLMKYATVKTEAKKEVPGYNYFKKYMHSEILIVFMVQCFFSTSKDLAKMLMEKYVTFAPQEKSAVFRLNVSKCRFQITKLLDIITFLWTKLQPTTGLSMTTYQEHG